MRLVDKWTRQDLHVIGMSSCPFRNSESESFLSMCYEYKNTRINIFYECILDDGKFSCTKRCHSMEILFRIVSFFLSVQILGIFDNIEFCRFERWFVFYGGMIFIFCHPTCLSIISLYWHNERYWNQYLFLLLFYD